MTDKSATERLREMLDERGVEYETDDRNGLRETIWCGTAAFQLSPTAKMTMIVTPEQAIAATLGSGTLTADDVLNAVYKHGARWQAIADELNAELGSGTCKNVDAMANHGYFTCSECGMGVYGVPNHCPNCGKLVRA